MAKPIEYYLSLPPELIDMNDPEIPESIKIRAANAPRNKADAEKEQTK